MSRDGLRAGEERHAVPAEVSREELKAMMDRGETFVLVDALGPEHYASSHFPYLRSYEMEVQVRRSLVALLHGSLANVWRLHR